MPDGRERVDDVVSEALDKYEESQDGSALPRENAESDIRFGRLGEQWPDDIERQRRLEARPILTLNKCPAFVRQIVNDAKQNDSSIKVSPVDNGADVATADVINGLVRSIERRSNAEIAYYNALDHAVSGGFGFFRISTDYANDRSFDMEARIDRIANPMMVHWDTDSLEFDSSDWEYAFVSEFMREERFQEEYPGAELIGFENDRYVLNEGLDYDDRIQLAEYWSREHNRTTLYLLSNGFTFTEKEIVNQAKGLISQAGVDPKGMGKEELIGGYLELLSQIEGQPVQIARERDINDKKVIRRLINGVQVLEEDEWHGKTIPICPVWGEEVMIDGRRHFRSLIRDIRDAQINFNFWRSASTELVALAPRAPFIGPSGFVPEDQEEDWRTANTRSHSYLEYNGQVAPQRQPFAGIPAGALQEAANSMDDMKSIVGIYDASLGARSNETSGRAILARQKESDVANFHFVDNLSHAIRYAGQCLVEIIPYIYSTRSTIRILGEDQREKVVKLTQGETGDKGGEKLYNLSVGTYDVEVNSGPSMSTQRQESRELLIEIMRATPNAAPYMFDMVLELMDFQGADKAARRAKMMLPPHIQAAEAQEDIKDMPPEVQTALMQAKTQIEQLQKQLQALQSEQAPEREKIQFERQKAEAEIALKRLDAQLKAQDIGIKERGMNVQELKAQKDAEMDVMRMAKEDNNDDLEGDNGYGR